MKQKILLVGDYNRSDFLFIAKELKNEADFFFIEYLNASELKNRDCLELGKVLFWKDYADAYELLGKIKPAKVLFYFIESFNHVALNVSAKTLKIPTYHLEHGLRFSVNFEDNCDKSPFTANKNKFTKLLRLGISTLIDKYKNRQFYLKTVLKSPPAAKAFLQSFYQVRSKHSIHETFQKIKDPFRIADIYISFSPAIFNYHKIVDGLQKNHPVFFTGIPQFDKFFSWKDSKTNGQDILFIDQPLFEQKLMGWTREYKIKFLKKLVHAITNHGKKLYIKPHPWNDIELYKTIQSPSIEILGLNNWESVIPQINVTIGFSSTLLLPFMAMQHITCFTMEVHPQKLEFPYSQFLLQSNACHALNDFIDLKLKINNLNYWHNKQMVAKEKFVHDYLYIFDGKSTTRLKNIIMDEVS